MTNRELYERLGKILNEHPQLEHEPFYVSGVEGKLLLERESNLCDHKIIFEEEDFVDKLEKEVDDILISAGVCIEPDYEDKEIFISMLLAGKGETEIEEYLEQDPFFVGYI